MKIGLPKALLYYRFNRLWEGFFHELGFETVTSGDTCKETVSIGAKYAMDECCLPLKVYLGHVRALIGQCDYILVPRLARSGKNDEYCVRFWGLPDIVRNTFRHAPLLSYNIDAKKGAPEPVAFIRMGRALGRSAAKSLSAYQAGCAAQLAFDRQSIARQEERLSDASLKVLIAAQPYIVHDPYVGGLIRGLIERQGGFTLFSDCCDRRKCAALSKGITRDIYWTLNKEMLGAIALHKTRVNGIILLTAFPCGTDSLAGELAVRKVKDVPLVHIVLDEHTAPAGLETRVESFMDILRYPRPSGRGGVYEGALMKGAHVKGGAYEERS